MPDIVERLSSSIKDAAEESELLDDALQEIRELRKRRDHLEEILILLVRTGLPWEEDGQPNDVFPHFQERYERVMHEASGLLGLEMRSSITRTEPRT